MTEFLQLANKPGFMGKETKLIKGNMAFGFVIVKFSENVTECQYITFEPTLPSIQVKKSHINAMMKSSPSTVPHLGAILSKWVGGWCGWGGWGGFC